MRRLEGRVALVTGSASGIGRATAERRAAEGAAIAITDVQDEAGEQTAAAIRDAGREAFYVHLDVTDAVERVLAERGRLDILVNNAGLGDLARDRGDEPRRLESDGRGRPNGRLPRHERARRR